MDPVQDGHLGLQASPDDLGPLSMHTNRNLDAELPIGADDLVSHICRAKAATAESFLEMEALPFHIGDKMAFEQQGLLPRPFYVAVKFFVHVEAAGEGLLDVLAEELL